MFTERAEYRMQWRAIIVGKNVESYKSEFFPDYDNRSLKLFMVDTIML